MAVSRTLIKATALRGVAPGEYLLRISREIEVVRGTGGIALGVMDGISFETRRIVLRSEVTGLPPTDILRRAVSEVRAFSASAPQSDDITALALHYHARPPDA